MVSCTIRRLCTKTSALSALAAALLAISPAHAQSLVSPAADLDQARNGGPGSPVSPINWVNGNLNATQAHYREGYSVPYRVAMGGLATGAGNPHSLVIEWDITKGSKHALDFITHYNRLEPHLATFGHNAEAINPLAGLSGTYVLTPPDPGNADVIPPPSSTGSPVPGQPTAEFNSLPLNERRITIYNGTITGLSYINNTSPGTSDGSSRLKIDFIANSADVVILWGGHIATSLTWGVGNSAAQISGSSYHTRLISLDGASTGNQDRSLMASAVVIPPPPCGISGLDAVCPGSTNDYSAPDAANATYAWTISSSCGATFANGQTTASGQNVSVIACPTCGSYVLGVDITANGQTTHCEVTVSVVDSVAPQISGSIPPVAMQCNTALPAPATNITQLLSLISGGTITDNCTATANLLVSSSDGGLTGTACNGSRVRTYTVTDACGNASTITQTFNIQDNTPPAINGSIPAANLQCDGTLPSPATTIAQLLALMNAGGTIADNCTAQGSLTVTSADGPLTGTACNGSRVRTYTVRDACNNASTITQTFNIHDTMAPVITGSIPAVAMQCNTALPAPATTIAQLLALMNAGGTITDNCGGALTVTSSDGSLSGTACNGSRMRTYTVSDPCGNSSTITQTFNIQDNTPPTITGSIPAVALQCNGALPAPATTVAQLLALMNAGGTITDNCTAQGSLKVTSSDGALTGTACNGSRVRTYTVTDTCGNASTITQTFNVHDTTGPTITGTIASSALECSANLPAPATTVAQLLALMSGGATISDNCTAQAELTVSNIDSPLSGGNCSGVRVRTYFVSDACGNMSAPVTQTFNIQDTTNPVISGVIQRTDATCDGTGLPPAATTIAQLLALMNQGATITDNCTPTNNLTVSHTDSSEGTGCSGAITRTYRVTDQCKNFATIQQIFSFSDSTAPQITCPSNVDVECGNALPAKAMTLDQLQAQGGDASDNCGLQTVAWVSDVQISPDGQCPIVIQRTYRATDNCNNSTECVQTLRVIDTTPPVLCCVPDVYGCVGYPVTLHPPVVTDECGMTLVPVPVRSDGLSLNDPFPPGDTTITWTATDGCGNKSAPYISTVHMSVCESYLTKTQNGWATGGQQTVALIQQLMTAPLGQNVVIGKKTVRSLTIPKAAAACLLTRLPATGSPAALPANLGDPVLNGNTCNTSPALPLTGAGKFSGTLLGHTIALNLNLRYDKLQCSGKLGDLELCPVMATIDSSGVIKTYTMPGAVLTALGNNKTVANLNNLANKALAGQSVAPATVDSLNTAVNRVNTMFDGGNNCIALLSSSCATPPKVLTSPTTPPPSPDPMLGSAGTVENLAGGSGSSSGSQKPQRTLTHLNDALVAPSITGGLLTIDGNYQQTKTGTLLVQLRGSDPIAGYDVVTVSDTAYLGGSLLVDLADDFMPTIGQEFQIITARSVVGQFTDVKLAEIDGDAFLDIRYTPTAVFVDAKPTPTIPGDLNRDGTVDINDMLALTKVWGQPDVANDLNGDGMIDVADLTILLSNWGSRR